MDPIDLFSPPLTLISISCCVCALLLLHRWWDVNKLCSSLARHYHYPSVVREFLTQCSLQEIFLSHSSHHSIHTHYQSTAGGSSCWLRWLAMVPLPILLLLLVLTAGRSSGEGISCALERKDTAGACPCISSVGGMWEARMESNSSTTKTPITKARPSHSRPSMELSG